MASWLVADSLYCPEQYEFSHLDSYGHYLLEAGEHVRRFEFTRPNERLLRDLEFDVAFMLDRYELALDVRATKRIAQVAARCRVMPWEVRRPDGSPAFALMISSIPALVEEARGHGQKAEYQALCFDLRARAMMMGVKRDIDCLFIGTTGGNHVRRTQLLEKLKDVVTVLPPVFGREMFRTLARAHSVFHCGAEWAKGADNAMRIVESLGMGAAIVLDEPTGPHWPPTGGPLFEDGRSCVYYLNAADARSQIASMSHAGWREIARRGGARVLDRFTYEVVVPELIRLAKEV